MDETSEVYLVTKQSIIKDYLEQSNKYKDGTFMDLTALLHVCMEPYAWFLEQGQPNDVY